MGPRTGARPRKATLISIRRVSLGGGYRYLLRSVAAGDGAGGANPLPATTPPPVPRPGC